MNASTRQPVLSSNAETCLRGGVYELVFDIQQVGLSQSTTPLRVSFYTPSGERKLVRGFVAGSGEIKARAYVGETGTWTWDAQNEDGRQIGSGRFRAEPSRLPGKLRVSKIDPRQFRYDNGEPFLHLGDTAYRYTIDDEPGWEAYLGQAAQAGFTKIRAWLSRLPGDASALFHPSRKSLEFAFWDEADRRLIRALERHPRIQFQLLPFGDDQDEVLRYGRGDPAAQEAFEYARERFGALPNAHWCLTNELLPPEQARTEAEAERARALLEAADKMGRSFKRAEQWGTLATVQHARFAPPEAAELPWCDIATLCDLGQVAGRAVLSARARLRKPAVLEEDRQETRNAPLVPRYYFRRLFWATLLSGGHPTYGGLATAEPHDGHLKGVQGYYDACHSGRLREGAHDFLRIARFFAETGLSLEQWTPDDALCGGNPRLAKGSRSPDGDACIVYVANPDSHMDRHQAQAEDAQADQSAAPSETYTTFALELPFAKGIVRWYDPNSGEWKGQAAVSKASTTLLTPEPGDWIAYIQRG